MLASILINNYNYEKYLEEAIISALNQTYDTIEVVVVDDGSTDGSRQVIEKFGDRLL
jgi:glycosyltransferase involved in cell wall biosynthesis